MATNPAGTYPRKTLAVNKVHGDLSQEVIHITVDRLRVLLHRHWEAIGKSRDWMAPASLLVSLVLTFATTEFKNWILPAPTWKAVFLLLSVASAVWLAVTLRNYTKSQSVDDLVETIKKQEL